VKVLAIAPQPFFSPRGTPLSVYYRTMVTAELGHQVDLLTYGQGVDPDIPGVRIVRIPAFRWLGEVKVGPSLLKAFLDVWIFWYAVAMMVRHRYDVVHAHEEAVFFCRFLQPIFRYKLVYDLHSILSQQLTNFDFTRSRLLIGLFGRFEDGCLAKADAVISISPALAKYAVGRVRDPGAHFLIENSLFDPVRLPAPAEGDGDRQEAEPEWVSLLSGERPVVLYAGTFESYQGIDLLLEAFAHALRQWHLLPPQVRGVSPPVLLLLGGRPEQIAAAEQRAVDLGIGDDCHFGGTVSRTLAQRATREADVLTSPRTVGDNTPLKIYEQIASGVPLVATRIGSHTQVLSDDDCVLADPDPRALADGLITALRGGADITRRVANARALYESSYSPEAYRDKMKRLFDLLQGSND